MFWILLSASGFGAMPIFAKYAYADSVDLPTLLFLRFSLAGAFMALLMFARRLRWPLGGNFWRLVAMGAIGYAGQAFCYFAALQYASAGLTALLLYLYPVIVTVLSAVMSRRRMSGVRLLAVLAALLGTGLAVGGSLAGSALGIALGVGAALVYSVYILLGEPVVAAEGAIPAGAVVMLSGAVVYGVVVLWRGPSLPGSASGWGAVCCIALLSTVVAIVGFLAAMRQLGAADAATFSTLEPIVTVLLAAVFLREGIGLSQALGGAIILGAVVLLARAGADRENVEALSS